MLTKQLRVKFSELLALSSSCSLDIAPETDQVQRGVTRSHVHYVHALLALQHKESRANGLYQLNRIVGAFP